MQLSAVCPSCFGQNSYPIAAEGDHQVTCPACDNAFSIIFGTARSKRSRGNRRASKRDYDIRFTQNGRERFVQFSSNRFEEAELRARDQFLLSSVGDTSPRILENKTIGQHWQLNDAPLPASAIIGALVVLGLVALALISLMG